MLLTNRLYLADTEGLSEELFDKELRLLPAVRRDKLERLRLLQDKKLSLAVWLLLKLALREEGILIESEPLAVSAAGKPYLPTRPDIFFNLSHSGTMALMGIASCPIGVDIEAFAPGKRYLAGRFFAPEENAVLAAQPDEAAADRLFIRLWTLKESFIKATGTGFSLPLQAFSVLPEKNRGQYLLRQSYDRGDYRFFEYPEAFPSGGYALSCCLRGRRAAEEKPPLLVRSFSEFL